MSSPETMIRGQFAKTKGDERAVCGMSAPETISYGCTS